ncbi:unnamed protein product, partial [Prorocentrum cordatum]
PAWRPRLRGAAAAGRPGAGARRGRRPASGLPGDPAARHPIGAAGRRAPPGGPLRGRGALDGLGAFYGKFARPFSRGRRRRRGALDRGGAARRGAGPAEAPARACAGEGPAGVPQVGCGRRRQGGVIPGVPSSPSARSVGPTFEVSQRERATGQHYSISSLIPPAPFISLVL